MQTTRKSLRRNVNLEAGIAGSLQNTSIVSIFTRLISYSGVFSILMGFGSMSGIATTFGYSAIDIVGDTKSFIFQGLYPLFTLFFEKLTWSYWCNLIITSVCSWSVLLYVIPSLVVYFLYQRYFKAGEKKPQFKDKVQSMFKAYKSQSRYFKITFETVFVIAISILYKVFITLLLYGTFVAFSSVLILGFGLGFREGMSFAKEQIVEPQACAPYLKETNKNAEKTAYCSRVVVDGKELARGRVIAFNNERIFLYVNEWSEGKKELVRVPKSYPIRNAIIERVGTEDKPEK